MLLSFVATAAAGGLLEQPLHDLVTPAVEQDLLGAVVVGVVRKGEVSIHAFGTLANGKPPTERDRFEIGSVSKAFNGLLLADAIRRGEVQLDDPVSKHLDWSLPSGANGSPITLKHLATHTSGWPRLPSGFKPPNPSDPYETYDEAALRTAAERTALVDEPGESYGYSNLGPSVLGAALASAANTSWPDLVQDRLVTPLHLKDLQVDEGQVVQGHTADRVPVPQWTLAAFSPTGGIEASARDLTQLIVGSQVPGGALRGTFDLALTPAIDLGPTGHMALGWHVTPEGLRWHNGETGGFHALVALHAERSIGVVVLSDTANELVDAIGFSAVEMLAGQNVAPLDLPKRVTVPVASLATRVGTWGPAEIRLVDDHLVWIQAGQTVRLWPTSPTQFVIRRPSTHLTFSGDRLELDGPAGLATLTRSK